MTLDSLKQRRPALIAAAAAVIILASLVAWRLAAGHSPVPAAVQRQASFPIYYPVNAKLPKGYSLDAGSFRLAQPGVVIFSVGHTGGQHLIFSEEQQPGSDTINGFLKKYLPLRSPLSTKLGQAQVGAYGSPPDLRTVASLTVSRGPWLIITAPSDISQDDLQKVIQSLRS